VWQHQQVTQEDRLHPDQVALLDELGNWRPTQATSTA
jgi:hypothetical protein